MEKIRLLIKIERLRKRLNKITLFKSLSDPEVVILSQQIDRLLNQYHVLSEV